MACSVYDMPSVKSKNEHQLEKLFQYIFDAEEEDKGAILQDFQTLLAKKIENVKDSSKQMFFNFKETQKNPSDLLVENLNCIEKIKEVDKRSRAALYEDPNTQG